MQPLFINNSLGHLVSVPYYGCGRVTGRSRQLVVVYGISSAATSHDDTLPRGKKAIRGWSGDPSYIAQKLEPVRQVGNFVLTSRSLRIKAPAQRRKSLTPGGRGRAKEGSPP